MEDTPAKEEKEEIDPTSSPMSMGLSESLLHLRDTNKRLLLSMVGLPGRGKTFLAQKVGRYLNWLSYKTKVFDIGTYRREKFGTGLNKDFFNDKASVEDCCSRALDDVYNHFKQGGHCAIYDANNHTEAQRQFVMDKVKKNQAIKGLDVSLVWIEVRVDTMEAVSENISEMLKTSPDYSGKEVDENSATKEFQAMIARCNEVYEPLSADKNGCQSWIQIFGSPVVRVQMNLIHGYLMGRIVFFIMSFRTLKHEIYISRHGESMYNTEGKLGGNSGLSEQGRTYAKKLGEFIRSQKDLKENGLTVWSSTMRRTCETASYVCDLDKVVKWRALEEIDAGICDGLTVEQVKEQHPDIYAARSADKLRYRYPNGESYEDVISRLEQVIIEINRLNGPVLVVGHRAVLRCIYAYFLDIPSKDIPHLSVPLHTIIKLTPKAYGCDEDRLTFGVTSVDDAVADEVAKGSQDVKEEPLPTSAPENPRKSMSE